MVSFRILILAVIWCGFSSESSASQQKISGSILANLVTHQLNKEGLSAKPVIRKDRVFYGCGIENIIISKRDKSWKTIKLSCRTNKLWSYSFRNKIAGPVLIEHPEDLQKTTKHSILNNTKKVFVLKYSKLRRHD